MKLLITGGCGFLGSNIAASYLKEGADVVVIDAMYRQGGDSNLKWLQSFADQTKLKHFKIDLADSEDVNNVVKGNGPFDYVCHLAGQVAMTTSLTNPLRDFRTNALGTLNLLEAVRSYSPDTFVAYSSTNKVYGDLKKIRYTEGPTRYQAADFPDGFDESMPLDFASPYGCSKGSADQYVRDWYRNFGLKTVVFRHSSIYGGRQYATIDQGWIGWFCRQAIEQLRDKTVKPFTIAGSGKQVRDVLHAEDLIRLYRSAFEHRNEIAGEVFNIGGGMRNSLSLLELFALLEDVLDIDGKLRFNMGPRRKSDQDFFVADVGKVQRLLGWTPNVNTSEGISRMLEWAEGLSSD